MYTINLSSQITTIPYLVQSMLLDNNSFFFQKLSYRNGTNQPHHVIAVEVGTSGTYSTTKEVVEI
jgi:hypothetical protein